MAEKFEQANLFEKPKEFELIQEVCLDPVNSPMDIDTEDTEIILPPLEETDGRLHLSKDRKVSPMGWYQEKDKRWVPTVANSFGLPAHKSCPGETDFCKGCYAAGTENMAGVGAAMQRNFDSLLRAETVDGMEELLSEMIDRYVDQANSKGVRDIDRIFRIHWDGDFFSVDYAKAWARTIQKFPQIQFWAYTRSFVESVDVVPELVGIENLALYLSVDENNVDAAHKQREKYPSLQLAYCAEDYDRAEKLVQGEEPSICPENIGKYALMERGRGACTRCTWCFKKDGTRDVIFSVTHEYDVTHGQDELFSSVVSVELTKKFPATI